MCIWRRRRRDGLEFYFLIVFDHPRLGTYRCRGKSIDPPLHTPPVPLRLARNGTEVFANPVMTNARTCNATIVEVPSMSTLAVTGVTNSL